MQSMWHTVGLSIIAKDTFPRRLQTIHGTNKSTITRDCGEATPGAKETLTRCQVETGAAEGTSQRQL
jgi:hypothetical protein